MQVTASRQPTRITQEREDKNGCRNGQTNQSNQDTTTITKFKGTVESLACLGTDEEKKGGSFMIFQNKLHKFVLINYGHPSDITYVAK